jgi:hypothetical protein
MYTAADQRNHGGTAFFNFFVHGRQRHLQSQGSVERANQDVEAMLGNWMNDNKMKNSKKNSLLWFTGCTSELGGNEKGLCQSRIWSHCTIRWTGSHTLQLQWSM